MFLKDQGCGKIRDGWNTRWIEGRESKGENSLSKRV